MLLLLLAAGWSAGCARTRILCFRGTPGDTTGGARRLTARDLAPTSPDPVPVLTGTNDAGSIWGAGGAGLNQARASNTSCNGIDLGASQGDGRHRKVADVDLSGVVDGNDPAFNPRQSGRIL